MGPETFEVGESFHRLSDLSQAVRREFLNGDEFDEINHAQAATKTGLA